MNYHKVQKKIVHRAKLISPDGDVSPLCAKKPKPIDLSRAIWTIIDEAVTCPRCRKAIKEGRAS